jgi:hypothetical protein
MPGSGELVIASVLLLPFVSRCAETGCHPAARLRQSSQPWVVLEGPTSERPTIALREVRQAGVTKSQPV